MSLQDLKNAVDRYGSAYKEWLKICKEKAEYEVRLAGTPLFVGDVVYAIRKEYAKTIMDFMRRRTTLFLEEGRGAKVVEQVAAVYQVEFEWTDEKKRTEILTYLEKIKMNQIPD